MNIGDLVLYKNEWGGEFAIVIGGGVEFRIGARSGYRDFRILLKSGRVSVIWERYLEVISSQL